MGEDGTLELGDTLEQDTVPSVELELMQSSFEEQIRALVAELDEKEREVIRMRFGLDGEEPRTLQEIGEALGLSPRAHPPDREQGQGEAAPQPARPGPARRAELMRRREAAR